MDLAFPRSSSTSRALLCIALLISAVGSNLASIHIYDQASFRDVGNSYLLFGGSEGIFASTDQDSSYIKFENVTLWRTEEAAEVHPEAEHNGGLVQVIIFEAADCDLISGSAFGGQRSICCTPDLAKLEACKQGEVISEPSAYNLNFPMIFNVEFSGNDLSTDMESRDVVITKTGMYNLFFAACDPKLKGLKMSGKTLWKNPDGYLPGMRPVQITSWVVTVGAIRKAVSRILILCISMGYGVVKPTLSGLTTKVLLLGITYFLASEVLDITEYVGAIDDISGRARIFLVLPDAFLDACFILWIFHTLSNTLEQLRAMRSSVKLYIYRKFTDALVVTVIVSVAWISYEVYFRENDPFNEQWQSAWIITAFWDVLSFSLLCVVCLLWAPSQSSNRYAYSDKTGEDPDDEEAQSLTRATSDGDLSLVKQGLKEKNNDAAEAPEYVKFVELLYNRVGASHTLEFLSIICIRWVQCTTAVGYLLSKKPDCVYLEGKLSI